MRVVVYTPTRRAGGLDVNLASLIRQGGDFNLTWIVGDTRDRNDTHLHITDTCQEHGVTYCWFQCPSDRPSLCRSYNEATEWARELDADLLVSMQDYLWAPPDGVQRFVDLAKLYPAALLTGACSISSDPTAAEIADPVDPFTIFIHPYDGHRPREIGWEDVRLAEGIRRYVHKGPYVGIDVEWWEANWAAIPRTLLYDTRLAFDESYDRAVGHENQAYAISAYELGYNRVMDPGNHAISLPHRSYFPAETAELEKLRQSNMRYHRDRIEKAGYVPPLVA